MFSKCPPSTETHAGWSHLIWHNFVTVGDNWITICTPTCMWALSRRVKFGLKIPNCLGKMSENATEPTDLNKCYALIFFIKKTTKCQWKLIKTLSNWKRNFWKQCITVNLYEVLLKFLQSKTCITDYAFYCCKFAVIYVCKILQESCAIAKMTAQCALYMGALKIFGTPWLRQ